MSKDFTVNDQGGFGGTKERLIAVVNIECDEKNYGTYKSAQRKFIDSDTDWFLRFII